MTTDHHPNPPVAGARALEALPAELLAAGLAAHARLLPSGGAEWLLQVDDYELRVNILDAPHGRPHLDPSHLHDLSARLADSPHAVAVVLLWDTPALPAVALSARRIRALLDDPALLDTLLARARPVAAVVRDLAQRQVRRWEPAPAQAVPPAPALVDPHSQFAREFDAAVEAERLRSYRATERKRAALVYPVEAERALVLAVLDDALAGVVVADLVPRLAKLAET